MTVLFAVLIFVGIRFLRVSLPFTNETQFLHCAFIFVVLALTCLDVVKATAAALVGFIVFEVLNGDFSAIPGVLIVTIVTCLATGTVYNLWMDQERMTLKEEYRVALKTILLYGALNLLITLAFRSWSTMMAGTKAAAAALATITSALPIVVNSVVTVIGAAALYLPVHAICRRIMKG